nr:hypothetical protein [Rickettsia endosymbiont of Ceutorhynchus assimilis]
MSQHCSKVWHHVICKRLKNLVLIKGVKVIFYEIKKIVISKTYNLVEQSAKLKNNLLK